MPHLMLVETDPFLQRTLQNLFTAEGYSCTVAADEPQTRLALESGAVDLVVLDVGRLPEHGLALLRAIRSQYHTPILMLAPQRGVLDTIAGLEVGADDYLCEPFDLRELVARVRAQLRRAEAYRDPVPDHQVINLGEVTLDVERRDAFRAGVALKLTTREFDLLHLLARHRGKALASRWIIENVWGYAADPGKKALTMQVSRLRRKIEVDHHHPRLLRSIRGFGYELATNGEANSSVAPLPSGK